MNRFAGKRWALAALLLALAMIARADQWSFVWVGSTARGWTIVQGQATPKFEDGNIHFDLVASDATKYTVDAQVQKDGTAEVGLAGIGDVYAGITIMSGKIGKVAITPNCKVEILHAHNDFNSISIGNFGSSACKR